MPTPWPKPAPRIVKREAPLAGPAASAQAARAIRSRRSSRGIGPVVGRLGPYVSRTRGWDRSCGMSTRKASDLFVECLEAEGVKHVFGIPGEETLDLNESLERS